MFTAVSSLEIFKSLIKDHFDQFGKIEWLQFRTMLITQIFFELAECGQDLLEQGVGDRYYFIIGGEAYTTMLIIRIIAISFLHFDNTCQF